MRSFFDELVDVMARALDCRLYAPHVRVVIVYSHCIRHYRIQIVIVFRQRFKLNLNLGGCSSGVILGISNCYSNDVAVVHNLVLGDYMVSLFCCQSSRCEGEECQSVASRNVLGQNNLVNSRHLFCF